jgi:hypothetical protein
MTSCGGFRRLGGGASSEPSSEPRRVCRVARRVGSPANGSAVLRHPALGLCGGGGPQARPRARPRARLAGGDTGGCAGIICHADLRRNVQRITESVP